MAGSHLPFCEKLKPLLEQAGLRGKAGMVARAPLGGGLPPAVLREIEAAARAGGPRRQAVDDRRQPAEAGPRAAARAGLSRRFSVELQARRHRQLHQGERAMNERLRLRPVVNESGIEIRPVYTA